MLTSLAVVKEHVLTKTGMWLTVQNEDTTAICKGRQIGKNTNSRDMWTRIETKTAKNSAEREEMKSKPKRSMSFRCNNYNVKFVHLAYHHHVLTCDMQICIGCNHHVLITTMFICINQVKCDMYLV